MESSYGKLVLLRPDGPDQEFELAKADVSIGRALTNDLTLDDERVSRYHARISRRGSGVTVKDLDSGNGTQVNDDRIEQVTLVPGDVIGIGNQQLKYSVDRPTEDVGLTVIDTQVDLDQTVVDEFLPVAINETTTPRLVVHTPDKTWSVDLVDLDRATIGRDESCAVFIDADNVSRRHAELQRKGMAYLVKDLDSSNGTWMGQEQIDEHTLRDGDLFRIGPAQIMFKQGFEEQALTVVDGIQAAPKERRTVVFVPGLMGSQLWLGNERVWPDVKTLFSDPEIFAYGTDVPLQPRGIVDEVVVVPNLIKQDQYSRLGDYLVDELAFRRNEDFFEFAYDWRQDVRTSARQLGQFIEGIRREQPIVLVGHSLGTYLIRYYADALGADGRVERLILMGGPHKGAAKVMSSLLVAPDVLPFGIMGERLRKIVTSFPTSYQIMPEYPVGTDQRGEQIDFLNDDSWLDPDHLPMLQLARAYRAELSPTLELPAISIFGYGFNTVAGVSVRRDADGKLEEVSVRSEPAGDGTVLERSAVLPGSEIHPVRQHHGSLYVDNDVKMRLKVELMRPY